MLLFYLTPNKYTLPLAASNPIIIDGFIPDEITDIIN